jgi:pimeloyl-ACP methyl ester carboxylesterase
MLQKFFRHLLIYLIIFFNLDCASLILKTAFQLERNKSNITRKEIIFENFQMIYHETGEKSNPTLVMIHGFGGDKDNWTRMAPYFYKNYHIIIPDLPGFGESSKDPDQKYSLTEQTIRLKKFHDSLNLGKMIFVGNSMGGALSIRYTLDYPDDVHSLILIDSAGVKSPIKSELALQLEKGNNPLLVQDKDDFDRLMGFIFVKKPYVPGIIKSYFAERSVASKPMNEKIFKDLYEDKFSIEPQLKKISSPTLILWGDQDRVIHPSSADLFEKNIKGSKKVIMKECGHSPQIERPEETAEIIIEFLSPK